jgi:hypothetical protein
LSLCFFVSVVYLHLLCHIQILINLTLYLKDPNIIRTSFSDTE